MLQFALGAGVVSLKKCQSAKRNMKRVTQKYGLHDMYVWAKDNALPKKLEDVQSFRMYALPYDYANAECIEGVVCTGKTQIEWIGQLGTDKFANRFALHIDGKSKLHVGRFTLVTIGTHVLDRARTSVDSTTNHSFRHVSVLY